MFFIIHNLMSMAPFSPPSDQMWADPERGRHQVLQPRMLRWFLQEQHGNLWELQLCVPQPTANAEAGGWYQNILQWWLSEAVQRGADTSERENAKMWDQNVLLIYTKTQRSLFKKKKHLFCRTPGCSNAAPCASLHDLSRTWSTWKTMRTWCSSSAAAFVWNLTSCDRQMRWIKVIHSESVKRPFFTSFYWIFRSKSETL